MKKAEPQDTLPAFADVPAVEERPPIIADRSTLENFANCPFAARQILDGKVLDATIPAVSGQVMHDAYSEVMTEYIESSGAISRSDINNLLQSAVRNARPDMQPDVIEATVKSWWSWSDWLSNIHPSNILYYDGDDRGEQPAHDFQFGDDIVRATSEIDFLCATASKEVLQEFDWKSGWKHWTAAAVKKSFQFQMHAMLVLEHFKEVNMLQVTIWNTRTNTTSYTVEFPRKYLDQWTARVRSAAGEFYQFRATEGAVPFWPASEKCGQCRAASLCPAVKDTTLTECEANPQAFVDRIAAAKAAVKQMEGFATDYVIASGGADIISDNGNAFGFGKPKTERKPTSQLYTVKT